MGYLTRTGHMNRQFVYDQWTVLAQTWWARLLPSTLGWRVRDEEPGIWEEFEWLAQTMAEMDRKAGVLHALSPEALARGIPISINQMREAVEIDEALLTVTVRLAPLPIPVTAARRQRSDSRRAGRVSGPSHRVTLPNAE